MAWQITSPPQKNWVQYGSEQTAQCWAIRVDEQGYTELLMFPSGEAPSWVPVEQISAGYMPDLKLRS